MIARPKIKYRIFETYGWASDYEIYVVQVKKWIFWKDIKIFSDVMDAQNYIQQLSMKTESEPSIEIKYKEPKIK